MFKASLFKRYLTSHQKQELAEKESPIDDENFYQPLCLLEILELNPEVLNNQYFEVTEASASSDLSK